nr:unnamed protein product [Digitaria exilis]
MAMTSRSHRRPTCRRAVDPVKVMPVTWRTPVDVKESACCALRHASPSVGSFDGCCCCCKEDDDDDAMARGETRSGNV